MTHIRDGIQCDANHPDFDLYVGLVERIDLAARSGTGAEFSYEDLTLLKDFGFLEILEQHPADKSIKPSINPIPRSDPVHMDNKLSRIRQCDKCPWKKGTDPRTIPHGYSETLHAQLVSTIAAPGDLPVAGRPLRLMGCHEHPIGNEAICVGWLMNQIGPGNNIALRLAMRSCENLGAVQLDGPQHERFEDTLPKGSTSN